MQTVRLMLCWLVGAYVLLASAGAGAQVLKNEELLEKSGVVNSAREIPAAILKGFASVQATIPSLDRRTMTVLNGLVPVSFKPERILDTIDDALTEELSEAEMNALRAFYSTDTAQRLYEAHKATIRQLITNPLKVMGFPQSANISTGRAALYREILEASETLEDAVSTMRIVNVAIPAAVMSALKQPVDPEAMQSRHMREQAQLMPLLQQQLYAAHAYAYRNVGEQDLENYLAFLKTPTGKRYHALMRKLLAEALMIQTDDFAKRLVKELGLVQQ